MCMNCVAQSTPMIAVGFAALRRQALRAYLQRLLGRRRRDEPPAAPVPGRVPAATTSVDGSAPG